MNAARQGGRCLQAADGPSRSARGAAHRGPRATDALTGIPNRGAFERTLRRHLRDAQAGRSFVLALVDLDDFKRIKDTHGLLEGDRVLPASLST